MIRGEMNKRGFKESMKTKKLKEYCEESRHPCINCGKQWCRCHQDLQYRYPEYVPWDYVPVGK